jgi:hypothetical protein
VPTRYGNLYDGTFRPAREASACPARRVLVLSQCLAYLVDPPVAAVPEPPAVAQLGEPAVGGVVG